MQARRPRADEARPAIRIVVVLDRRWIASLLLALAALMTVAAGLGGWANRQVLDGPTFVANVDQVRRDPAVADALGARVADVAVRRVRTWWRSSR